MSKWDNQFEERPTGSGHETCHKRIAELEAERKIDKDVLLKQDQTIQLRNAELQTAHEIGARHAKRVGEQAIELQALREAAEALVKSGFRVEREDFSTNVDSAKFDALQAALGGGGDE